MSVSDVWNPCSIRMCSVQAKFGYRLDDPKWAPDWLSNEQLEMLHSDIDARQVIDGEFDQILKDLKVSLHSASVSAACSALWSLNKAWQHAVQLQPLCSCLT